MPKYVDEWFLQSIVRQAIKEGKLFELIFTENGRRLWKGWPEHKFKKLVLKELKRRR